MNKLTKATMIMILSTILIQGNSASSNVFAPTEEKIADKTLTIVDNDTTTELPKRFRILKDLNISGSQQFTPTQLENIVKSINKNKICIVDLRQEAHGFVNDIAISYHNNVDYPFACYDSKDTLQTEKRLLGNIKKGEDLNLYTILGDLKSTVKVDNVNIEEKLVKGEKLDYVLFAVKDGSIPTPIMVDSFVEFIKNKPEDLHLHFHCKEGEGRTTTFMALYQMMNNKDNLTLSEILDMQVQAGGIVLTTNNGRNQFLENFYNYVIENKSTNYEVPYSVWIIESKLVA